jgi:hypothetical protein
MFRLATILALGALSAARADVAPPPGHQRVPVDHIIETDQTFPDQVFFVIIGADPQWSYRCQIGPETPVRIAGAARAGRAQICWLVAVPKSAAAGYLDDAAILRAILARSVPGVLKTNGFFDAFEILASPDAPAVIERRHQIRRLTPEEGIVLTTVSDSGAVGSSDGATVIQRSLLRWAVATFAVAAAILGVGMWLRSRRRVAAQGGTNHAK